MKNKTGNFTIIAGETLEFTSEEITFNSFSDIENITSQKIIKNGELNGRMIGNYTDLNSNDIKIKDIVTFNFYHTWVPTQEDTRHLGNDNIVVNEKRIIKVLKNGEELKESTQRFVTDYFAHVNDNNIFDGLAYSTYYYHDFTDTKRVLKQENYRPMIEVVKKYAEEVAEYKRIHRGGSPVQAKAVKNRSENEATSTVLTSTSVLGTIISQIPNPYTKYGGKVISGISGGLKTVIMKAEHADRVAIMFKLEYEK